MATKNVKVNGSTYPGIGLVELPLADGNGVAKFVETSDATATAEDVAKGKLVYVKGAQIEGTHENTAGAAYGQPWDEIINKLKSLSTFVAEAKIISAFNTYTDNVLEVEYDDTAHTYWAIIGNDDRIIGLSMGALPKKIEKGVPFDPTVGFFSFVSNERPTGANFHSTNGQIDGDTKKTVGFRFYFGTSSPMYKFYEKNGYYRLYRLDF